jgi:hypothetical protein
MNDIIRELAEQASLYARSDNSSMLFENYHNRYTEKFAQLIVKDCADLVQKYMTRWPEDCELTKQIKEYFGVEE